MCTEHDDERADVQLRRTDPRGPPATSRDKRERDHRSDQHQHAPRRNTHGSERDERRTDEQARRPRMIAREGMHAARGIARAEAAGHDQLE
jgi:hypothetical protein